MGCCCSKRKNLNTIQKPLVKNEEVQQPIVFRSSYMSVLMDDSKEYVSFCDKKIKN